MYSIEMLLAWSSRRTVTQPSGFMSGPTKPWWAIEPWVRETSERRCRRRAVRRSWVPFAASAR